MKKFFNWYWKKCTLPGRLNLEPKSYIVGFGAGILTMVFLKHQKAIKPLISNSDMEVKAKELVDKDFAQRYPLLKSLELVEKRFKEL